MELEPEDNFDSEPESDEEAVVEEVDIITDGVENMLAIGAQEEF